MCHQRGEMLFAERAKPKWSTVCATYIILFYSNIARTIENAPASQQAQQQLQARDIEQQTMCLVRLFMEA